MLGYILQRFQIREQCSFFKCPIPQCFRNKGVIISQLSYKSSGDWIIDVNHGDQKLDKQDQPILQMLRNETTHMMRHDVISLLEILLEVH